MTDGIKGKAKGGKARAAILTNDERSKIAKIAANARWNLPTPTHYGKLILAGVEISCANLDDGTRVLSERGVATALGARGGGGHWKKKKGASAFDLLPEYVSIKALAPFISGETREMLLKPISYKSRFGPPARGIPAILLPEICQIWLTAREKGAIEDSKHLLTAAKAEILMRGFAHVGIIALVDEATGFQKDREKDSLAKILEAFIAKELQPWVRAFEIDFYEELFRLRGLAFSRDSVKRPQYFGILTNDIVYKRLAPCILEELKRVAEKNKEGKLTHKLHQKLTPNFGHPKLREFLSSVVTIMKLSNRYPDFLNKLDAIHPRFGQGVLPGVLSIGDYDKENDDGSGI